MSHLTLRESEVLENTVIQLRGCSWPMAFSGCQLVLARNYRSVCFSEPFSIGNPEEGRRSSDNGAFRKEGRFLKLLRGLRKYPLLYSWLKGWHIFTGTERYPIIFKWKSLQNSMYSINSILVTIFVRKRLEEYTQDINNGFLCLGTLPFLLHTFVLLCCLMFLKWWTWVMFMLWTTYKVFSFCKSIHIS